ncbi:MAG: bifunctional tetrahydrofolate synthase/dihydrofolate synthase [Luteimonas sp.]
MTDARTARTLEQWLAYVERQHPAAIELGLERVHEVAERMGLARPAARVVTVAGTNGKGSTVAFVEAIARAAGLKVGAYTSPHLFAYNERVRIDGVDAADDTLAEAFAAVEMARGQVALTYFEYGTLAAFWLFERADLDLAVLEVGLGGRLDAVNLVDADVAVITTVDLDHQDWLGDDREAIGREKAGIARPGRPLVLGEDDPPSSVLGRAYAIGAPAIRAGCDFFFEPADGSRWRWRELDFELDLPLPRLDAPSQLRNAATAIAALRALDIEVPANAIATGVSGAQLPGRLQRVVRGQVEIVVDVAHNPQAARELAAWQQNAPAAGRTLAVFAALADKDIAGVVAALADGIDAWFVAGLADAGARGLDGADFAARLAGTAAAQAVVARDVATALAMACDQARDGDRVLVFGSFLTAAAALRWLHVSD